MELDKIEKLKKLGGTEWKNYGLHRIYFNKSDFLKKAGISINDGIFSGRFWYDVDKDKFYSQNLDGKLKRFIVDTINELIYDN